MGTGPEPDRLRVLQDATASAQVCVLLWHGRCGRLDPMKSTRLLGLVCTLVCLAASPAFAKEKPGKGAGRNKEEINTPTGTVVGGTSGAASEPKGSTKEPWVWADVRITDDERHVIKGYVEDYPGQGKPGKKSKQLPPGLAKKVARGEQLPPGWQKKCVAGQVMPVEVYEKTHPLPPELAVKLPPPRPGTITVTVGGKVVRLLQATREILDVFDVHLGR
jgi:hypothetical protein